jgi:pyruvate/2-oxoglutarate dehydrogenase complex dihydrolipoamide dehydrogenase (E3) component
MLSCDFLVIGAGQTGLYLAQELVKTQKKVILVEEEELGGAYLFGVDVPASLLIKESQGFFHSLKSFKDNPKTFTPLLAYRESLVTKIGQKLDKNQEKIEKNLKRHKNFSFLKGKAEFSSKTLVEVNSESERHLVTFEQCAITVGKRYVENEIAANLKEEQVLHPLNVFHLEVIPSELGLVDLTPKNIEIADYYANLGIKVRIFEKHSSSECLPELDRSAYNYLLKSLYSKQVEIKFETEIAKIEVCEEENIRFEDKDKNEYFVSHIYLDYEKTFEEDNLGLKKIGLKYDKQGVFTKKSGRTGIPTIWAFGDCNKLVSRGNKFSMVRKFLERTNSQFTYKSGINVNLGLNFVTENDVYTINKTKVNKINTTFPVAVFGLSEEVSTHKYGADTKTFVLDEADQEGFMKIIYKVSSGDVLGVSLGGDYCSKYEAFSMYVYKHNLDLRQAVFFLEAYRGF